MSVYAVLFALLCLLLLALAYIGLLFLGRGTPIERIRVLDDDGEPASVADPQFCDILQFHVSAALEPGNRVEVLANGDEVYPALWDELSAAQHLITWHVFWFKPGILADRVKSILTERAQAGVRVLYLYDAYGSWGLGSEYREELRRAGVEVACFRPLHWKSLHKFQQRSHIRAVVVDGRVGFTGGFGIDDLWMGDGRHLDQWRDTSVRLEGPAVLQLQSAFAADWAEATGQLIVGEMAFPPDTQHHDDGVVAGLIYDAPSIGSTNAERFFVLSIRGARETLYITNAYFVPDDDFRRMLAHAVERGVDVRVLTPGINTDKKSTWYAGRAHYEELLASGVRIYEYEPTMIHAKTLVADGVWSAIGTNNFDNRSMALNDEVLLMVHDRGLGERMHRMFLRDLEHATEVDLDVFRRRGLGDRIRERAYVLFSRVL